MSEGADVYEVPIAAIEHYSYCPRQCALMYVEQVFEENLYTMRGRLAHERVHSGEEEDTRGATMVRALPLYCERLALRGVADLVELRPEGAYPVEYKSGPTRGGHAELQLCAQALCLEEMLGQDIRRGAIYSIARRQRREIILSEKLRRRTEEVITAVRELVLSGGLPPPVNDKRCPNCSLLDACLPEVVSAAERLRGLQGTLFHPWELAEVSDD